MYSFCFWRVYSWIQTFSAPSLQSKCIKVVGWKICFHFLFGSSYCSCCCLLPAFIFYILFDVSIYHLCWNSLFHVVVENDDKSTQIIRLLNSQKGGRVTFIPLNRVKAPRVSYPHSSDVIPLLKKLGFEDNFTPAFSQVCFCENAVFFELGHHLFMFYLIDTWNNKVLYRKYVKKTFLACMFNTCKRNFICISCFNELQFIAGRSFLIFLDAFVSFFCDAKDASFTFQFVLSVNCLCIINIHFIFCSFCYW